MVFQFDGQLAKGLLCRFVPVTKFSIIILSCHLLLSLKETKQYQFCCDFERLVSNLVELQEELFLSRKMQLVIIKNCLKIYTAELLFQSFIYTYIDIESIRNGEISQYISQRAQENIFFFKSPYDRTVGNGEILLSLFMHIKNFLFSTHEELVRGGYGWMQNTPVTFSLNKYQN